MLSEDRNYWTHRIGRRSMLRGGALAGAGIAAAALIGCGGDDDSSGTPGPGGTTTNPITVPGAEAQSGGTLTVGMIQGPPNGSLDMSLTSGIENTMQSCSFGDTLVIEDHEKNRIPGAVATSYEFSEDDLEVTFQLRPGVTFWDGSPLNAETVAFWGNRFRTSTGVSLARSYFGTHFEDVVAVDDMTVKWVFSQPTYIMESRLSRGYLSVPSRVAIEAMGNEAFQRAPVYSGPFKFQEWVQNSHVSYLKNPDYDWAPSPMLHTGQAYLDGIDYVEIPDSQSRADALVSGDIDIIEDVSPVQVDRFRNERGFKLFEVVPQGTTWSLSLNMQIEPTNDIRVRQAVAHAVDKHAVNDVVYFGLETPTHTTLTSTIFGYNPNQVDLYPHDPQRAAEILEGAGWVVGADGIREKDGQQLILSWLTSYQPVAELVQSQLREVGIGMDISVIIQNTARDDRTREAIDHVIDGGDKQTSFINEDPDVLRVEYHSSSISPSGQGGAVFRGYRNDHLDEILAKTAILPSLSEEREALLFEVQDIVMEDVARIPLYEGHKFLIAKDDVQGIHLWQANYYWYTYDMWRGEA